MNKHLTTIEKKELTTITEKSPWRQFADQELKGTFVGKLVTFNKGTWVLGENKTPIGATETFVVCMDELWYGWVRWWDGSVSNHRIGRVIDDFVMPKRDSLGDLDETKWKIEGSNPRDPWSNTRYLVLKNTTTGDLCTFTTHSEGGRRAVAKLADRYDRDRHKNPHKMPVVQLTNETYYNKTYKTDVDTPVFKVVGWDFWDDEAAIAEAKPKPPKLTAEGAAAEAEVVKLSDELDDEIPF